MKNYTKVFRRHQGHKLFRILNDVGEPVTSFDDYAEYLVGQSLSQSTINRYLDVVANFIDYLTEAKVFGDPASQRQINKVVNAYLSIRRHANRIRNSNNNDDSLFSWAKPLVVSLNITQLNRTGNAVAAINRFLRRIETVAREDWEYAESLGLPRGTGSYRTLIDAIDGFRQMSSREQHALKQVTMLDTLRGKIDVPRGLDNPDHQSNYFGDYLDFPVEHFTALINGANAARDRVLWLLLGGTGIRMSEAMNIKFEHIDIPGQRVFVEDPDNLRWAQDLPSSDKIRFKGRAISDTFFIPQFKQPFFKALLEYLKTEYIAGEHDYVFQSLRGNAVGEPMFYQTDKARIENFQRAVIRSGIPHPHIDEIWTPHSLRHMYGVYMLNYLPVPNGYGLMDYEVQKCMGHKTLTATRHYAREDTMILEAKLQYADQLIIQTTDTLDSLPSTIARRLRHAANQIEGISDV